MKKISTVQAFGNEIFREQKLTIGLDLGDRWSFYCVLDEAGTIILEQRFEPLSCWAFCRLHTGSVPSGSCGPIAVWVW